MPTKVKKIVEIKVPEIETLAILEEENGVSDEEIQAPPPKPKKVLTEKQKETLSKGRAIAHERRMLKDLTEKKKDALIQRQMMIDEKKKAVEDKLIKTAVAVKKKQLVEEARLAKYTKDIEEEIPDEVIKKIIREKKIPPKPTFEREEPQIQLPAQYKPNYPQYYFL